RSKIVISLILLFLCSILIGIISTIKTNTGYDYQPVAQHIQEVLNRQFIQVDEIVAECEVDNPNHPEAFFSQQAYMASPYSIFVVQDGNPTFWSSNQYPFEFTTYNNDGNWH